MEKIKEWQLQLFELLKDPSKIDSAHRHKAAYVPEHLYKYQAINPYSIKNLMEDTIWLRDPNNFNDPYDSGLYINYDQIARFNFLESFDEMIKHTGFYNLFTEEHAQLIKKSPDPQEEYYKLVSTKIENPTKFFEYVNQTVGEFREKSLMDLNELNKSHLKISSFSERNESILMWSHYANHHTGMCIQYNFRDHSITNLTTRLIYPIIYGTDLFDSTDFIKNAKENLNPFFPLIASLHKSEEWSYEKEWRMIFSNGIIEKECAYIVPTPTGVYIGSKASEENKTLIKSICEDKKIPLFQMKMNVSSFHLSPVLIT